MVGRIIIASLISAVLVFMWGFVFWGLSGATNALLSPLPAESDITAVLRSKRVPSGMYVYPMAVDGSNEEAMEDWTRQHEEGPILQLAYRAEGGPTMPPSMFAKGLALNFVVALLISILLAIAVKSLPSYGSRVGFVLLVSLATAIWANGGDAIWWFHSLKYCLGNAVYAVVAGLIMGLVTAAIIKPPIEISA